MHAGRYGRVFAELCVRDFVARWCASFRLPLPPLPPVRQLGGAVRRRKQCIWWRMRALADPPCHFYLPLNCVATGMQLTQLSLHAEEARAAAGARPPRPPAHNGTCRPRTTRHQAVTRAGRGSLLSNGTPSSTPVSCFHRWKIWPAALVGGPFAVQAVGACWATTRLHCCTRRALTRRQAA